MELVRFFAFIVQIALLLALAGELKSCTLDLLGHAAQASGRGMISYRQYTRLLNQPEGVRSHEP